MLLALHRWLIPAVLAGWLGVFTPASAAAAAVQDNAKLFEPETFAKADRILEHLKNRFQVDLRIETFAGVPADKRLQIEGLASAKERAEFFKRWAKERAQASGVDGIYVLIVKDEKDANLRRIQVVVGPETSANAFTARDGQKLREALVHDLDPKRKSPDQGLLDAVNSVYTTVEDNLHRWDWAWVLWVIFGLVAVWLLIELARKLLGDSPQPLGGLFGAGIGFWLYGSLQRWRAARATVPTALPVRAVTTRSGHADPATREDLISAEDLVRKAYYGESAEMRETTGGRYT